MTAVDGEGPELTGSPASGGLSWSWDLDLEALLAALSEPAPWNHAPKPPSPPNAADPVAPEADSTADVDPDESEFAEYLDAVDAGQFPEIPWSQVAGRVAEFLEPGPGLAAWLAGCPAGELEGGALAGVAAACRRLASWAQAGELAVVAEMASRCAAADDKAGTDEQGRPVHITADACGQVSLALTLSQSAAEWWTDLAVTLKWRLAATGEALRSGDLDLSRARTIADATSVLNDQAAKDVEAKVLRKAGTQTIGQLRAALRRAVIAADPEGADRRREETERRAKVTLYPDAEGTASLAGYNLPGIRATAAMARITTLARSLKANGADGGIDFLRAHVFLGLLLGTLPPLEPAADAASPTGNPPAPETGDPSASDDGNPPDRRTPPGDGGPQDGTALDNTPATDDGSPDDDYDSYEQDPGTDLGLGTRARPWPPLTAILPPAPPEWGIGATGAAGYLYLGLPWSTLIGESAEPGQLNRLGPITPSQATELAGLALSDPAVDWQVVLTDATGQVLAVGKVPRISSRDGPSCHASLIRRVTVTVSPDDLEVPEYDGPLARIMTIARRLAAATDKSAVTGPTAAEGGCAHTQASQAYRPPPTLHEFIAARDQTCRFPTCRQPATRCDLDHTHPHDQGGPTCPCNLGPLCRHHHQLKQHPHWHLTQPTPGTFTWTTPAGRTYTAQSQH